MNLPEVTDAPVKPASPPATGLDSMEETLKMMKNQIFKEQNALLKIDRHCDPLFLPYGK